MTVTVEEAKPTTDAQPTRAHIIVIGNAKGGSGKSTTGMHVIVSLLTLGYRVVAVDRNADALQDLSTRAGPDRLETEVQDLEGANWPLKGRKFDGVIVCNYLYRPFLPQVLDLVDVGGLLIYETFALAMKPLVDHPTRTFCCSPTNC